METNFEKYQRILRGHEGTRMSISAIRALLSKSLSIKENYQMKFHLKSMEELGMIRESNINGTWEIGPYDAQV